MRALGSGRRLALVLLGAAVAVSFAMTGCAPQNTTGQTGAATTDTPAATSTAEATSAPVIGEPTSTPAVEPTAAPPSALPYKPGPDESGTNWAYLKKLVLDDGYVYATVDYIIIGEGPDGWFITNDNPKLRTFPLAAACPCRYLKEGGSTLSAAMSPSAFMTKWKSAAASKMIRKNPYKLTVKHGVITKLDNEWLP